MNSIKKMLDLKIELSYHISGEDVVGNLYSNVAMKNNLQYQSTKLDMYGIRICEFCDNIISVDDEFCNKCS